MALARGALAPGGTVFLRTDDADYFQQMNEVFDAVDFFEKTDTPAALSEITTDFERDFNFELKQPCRPSLQLKIQNLKLKTFLNVNDRAIVATRRFRRVGRRAALHGNTGIAGQHIQRDGDDADDQRAEEGIAKAVHMKKRQQHG